MTSEGPNFPDTVNTSDPPGTSLNWTNPGNVAADDGTNATITSGLFDLSVTSFRLECTDFDFAIPGGATILGIEVTIERQASAGQHRDTQVQLIKGGSTSGDNKADTATNWPSSMTAKTYGGPTDLWGLSWSPSDINATNFGVAEYGTNFTNNVQIAMDYISITVYYSVVTNVAVGQATETDTAQPIAIPLHRMVNQALETDTAQAISPSLASVVTVGQAEETDTAQPIRANRTHVLGQATETDTAQPIAHAKTARVGQALETDSAQTITPGVGATPTGQAVETDTAQPITPRKSLGQAVERDRAQQITVLGGVTPPSQFPVLIRAPGRAGRVHHEFSSPGGDSFIPTIARWQAEEEAPGGFGPATGLISRRLRDRHPECFQEGSTWRTLLEDGTCIHAGRLTRPDADENSSVIQLADRGRAQVVEREVGPILYQAHVGSEVSEGFFDSDRWRASMKTMTTTFGDTEVQFDRNEGATASGNATMVIPFFGRELAHLRMHLQGSYAFIAVLTSRRERVPSNTNSAELDVSGISYENWYANLGAGLNAGEVDIDLVLASGALTYPNTAPIYTNAGDIDDTGWGFVWPDLIFIQVGDWEPTAAHAAQANVLLQNIEINGAPLGSRRKFSVLDLVEDIAARLGFSVVNAEGGDYDILPYELLPGIPAAEALDMACLLTGKRYRITDNGVRAVFEFGRWDDRRFRRASPWSRFDFTPLERYDAVAVPYSYPGMHGQLTDQVIVRVENSPLLRRNVFYGLEVMEPMHNADRARDIGARWAEHLVRPRRGGSFSAAELIDENGQKLSAHHAFAGDMVEGGRVGRLTRFDDHVEGEFNGDNLQFEKVVARRDRRVSLTRR